MSSVDSAPLVDEPARALLLPPQAVHAVLRAGVRRVAIPFSPLPERLEFEGGGAYWRWQPRAGVELDNIMSKWPDALFEHAPIATGDVLWVKETWAEFGGGFVYKADSFATYPGGLSVEAARADRRAPRWRSPVHMPREACRLVLVVTRVHGEQVRRVTERGALAEGVTATTVSGARRFQPLPELPTGARQELFKSAKAAYGARWDEVYGRKGAWEEDPWVWRVEFEVSEGDAPDGA